MLTYEAPARLTLGCDNGANNIPPAYPFTFDDGGRAAAGYRGRTGDCACRAVAIATGLPYQQVYDDLIAYAAAERPRGRRKRSHPRLGVHGATMRRYLERHHGWSWHPTMQIGVGTTVHLRPDELPDVPRLIVCVSRHYLAIVDGVIRDTGLDDRDGTRCVYGYYLPPVEVE